MQNRLLIVGILAVILFHNVQCQGPITCTAGYYRPGETAKITCHYHADITTDRNSGAYIQRHTLDARDSSSGTEVTVCHFSGGSVSVCDPEPGYRFVSFTSRNLTIDVPHVSAEFQGRYTCGLVPPPGESPSRAVHDCLLVVEDVSQLEEKTNVQNGPGVHAGLHGHVQATLALLIIVIIAAVALIVYAVVAYNKTWFPFRKISKHKKKDAEKGEKLDFGDSRPILQETTNPTFNANVSALPPPVPEKEPLVKEDNERSAGSAREDELAAKRGRAVEIKPETEDERRDRENREIAKRAEEEIRQEEGKLEGLKQKLNDATGKEEKKNIEREKNKSKDQLKKLRKAEEDRKKRLEKEENERKKREGKERKESEKAEKGKKK